VKRAVLIASGIVLLGSGCSTQSDTAATTGPLSETITAAAGMVLECEGAVEHFDRATDSYERAGLFFDTPDRRIIATIAREKPWVYIPPGLQNASARPDLDFCFPLLEALAKEDLLGTIGDTLSVPLRVAYADPRVQARSLFVAVPAKRRTAPSVLAGLADEQLTVRRTGDMSWTIEFPEAMHRNSVVPRSSVTIRIRSIGPQTITAPNRADAIEPDCAPAAGRLADGGCDRDFVAWDFDTDAPKVT
jgi:hypothetical protein